MTRLGHATARARTLLGAHCAIWAAAAPRPRCVPSVTKANWILRVERHGRVGRERGGGARAGSWTGVMDRARAGLRTRRGPDSPKLAIQPLYPVLGPLPALPHALPAAPSKPYALRATSSAGRRGGAGQDPLLTNINMSAVEADVAGVDDLVDGEMYLSPSSPLPHPFPSPSLSLPHPLLTPSLSPFLPFPGN